ncbi:PPC domain-containing DNA-binding protein [Persicitalea sp.]|uniref:PPC domain-containing DNA-binding protein n=1 Tax=Persicitalea sp. TaxID=3100273 RepID=UPI0035940D75
MLVHTIRLLPGQDLKNELVNFVNKQRVEAGFILTGVGSLTNANIRLANQDTGTEYLGYFELISLAGTLSVNGSHLHIAIADSTGQTTGGHLLEGCKVYTTAEIVIGVLPETVYKREPEPASGYDELNVYRKQRK